MVQTYFSKLIILLFLYKLQISFCKIMCDNVNVSNKDADSIIKIHSGKIKGMIRHNILYTGPYTAFKGIPYAEAPIGKKRFLPPTDVKPWTGVRKAYHHGNICPQVKKGVFEGNEDCLYLNVYTPVTNFDFNHNDRIQHPKLAVMVWIHGGAFIFGSGNSDLYGPDFLISKNVIVVSLNYRLGVPGFLNLHNSQVPGNAGLKDQNLALKWVKRNIGQFGGDIERITIFGQSAGGVSVDMHLISKMSRGLFHRSIALSGSALCPWAVITDPIERAKKLAKHIVGEKIDNTTKLAQKFINMDIRTLIKETKVLFNIEKLQLPIAPSIESPNIDGTNTTFLDDCVTKKLKNGDFFRGEHVLGYTSVETNVLGRILESFRHKINEKIGYKIFRPIERALHYVIKNFMQRRLLKQSSFELFDKPIDDKRQLMSKYLKPGSLYYYYFRYEEEDRNLVVGAFHCDDLNYLFYSKNYNQICLPNSNEQSRDVNTRERLLNLFSMFAKSGYPLTHDFKWTPYDKYGKYLDIDEEGQFKMVKGNPHDDKQEVITPIDLNNSIHTDLSQVHTKPENCLKRYVNFTHVFLYAHNEMMQSPFLKSIIHILENLSTSMFTTLGVFLVNMYL